MLFNLWFWVLLDADLFTGCLSTVFSVYFMFLCLMVCFVLLVVFIFSASAFTGNEIKYKSKTIWTRTDMSRRPHHIPQPAREVQNGRIPHLVMCRKLVQFNQKKKLFKNIQLWTKFWFNHQTHNIQCNIVGMAVFRKSEALILHLKMLHILPL